MWRGSDHERGGQLILGINVQFTHIKHTLANCPDSHNIYRAQHLISKSQFLPPVSESSRGEGGSGWGPGSHIWWSFLGTFCHLPNNPDLALRLTLTPPPHGDWLANERRIQESMVTFWQLSNNSNGIEWNKLDMMKHKMTKTTNWHVQSRPPHSAFMLSGLFLTCHNERRKKGRMRRMYCIADRRVGSDNNMMCVIVFRSWWDSTPLRRLTITGLVTRGYIAH